MRELVRYHAPAITGLLAMLVVAATLATLYPIPRADASYASAFPDEGIRLPDAQNDTDLDSYANDQDLFAGDLLVWLNLTHLEVEGDGGQPYVVVGTQDDHGRTGAGAELQWRHVVDFDALG